MGGTFQAPPPARGCPALRVPVFLYSCISCSREGKHFRLLHGMAGLQHRDPCTLGPPSEMRVTGTQAP